MPSSIDAYNEYKANHQEDNKGDYFRSIIEKYFKTCTTYSSKNIFSPYTSIILFRMFLWVSKISAFVYSSFLDTLMAT